MILSWKTLKRFLSFVMVKQKEDCWEWQGTKDSSGYGLFRYKRRMAKAHRMSWVVHNGKKIPNKMCVCHTCDKPSCVNPHHLFIATHAENMKDMVEKGRSSSRSGTANPNCKLTEEEVRKIKECHAKGISRHSIAKRFAISVVTVDRIKSGTSWWWV